MDGGLILRAFYVTGVMLRPLRKSLYMGLMSFGLTKNKIDGSSYHGKCPQFNIPQMLGTLDSRGSFLQSGPSPLPCYFGAV